MATMLLLLAACGTPSPPSPVATTPTPTSPAPTGSAPVTPAREPVVPRTCDLTRRLTHGTLCILRPSALDPATRDVFGATGLDARLGLGWHVVGIPDTLDADVTTWVHFAGTYGRPYDPDGDVVQARVWLDELMANGHTVVHPAYVNRIPVNESCATLGPGGDDDDCAGLVRREVLTGEDLSPHRDVAVADSVDHRLSVLLGHLQSEGVVLPDGLDPTVPDPTLLHFSGHSQGGNLAYFVARTRGAAFACMLGSPYDTWDTVDPPTPRIADWFVAGTSQTPVSALGQVITAQDDNAVQFRRGAEVIGLTVGVEAFEVDAPPYRDDTGAEVSGHAASLVDPALAAARASACLRP